MPAPLAKPDDEQEEDAIMIPITKNNSKIILDDKEDTMVPYSPDENYGFSKKAITTQVKSSLSTIYIYCEMLI